jgi:hypothetical protein
MVSAACCLGLLCAHMHSRRLGVNRWHGCTCRCRGRVSTKAVCCPAASVLMYIACSQHAEGGHETYCPVENVDTAAVNGQLIGGTAGNSKQAGKQHNSCAGSHLYVLSVIVCAVLPPRHPV